MSRPPTVHDNAMVQAHLASFMNVSEVTEHMPQADDIISGVLELKASGSTSTRTLSRKVLFHVLQQCHTISTAAVRQATFHRYAGRTVEAYAAAARVASKALEGAFAQSPEGLGKPTIRDHQEMLDAPYMAELRSLGLVWPFHAEGVSAT